MKAESRITVLMVPLLLLLVLSGPAAAKVYYDVGGNLTTWPGNHDYYEYGYGMGIGLLIDIAEPGPGRLLADLDINSIYWGREGYRPAGVSGGLDQALRYISFFLGPKLKLPVSEKFILFLVAGPEYTLTVYNPAGADDSQNDLIPGSRYGFTVGGGSYFPLKEGLYFGFDVRYHFMYEGYLSVSPKLSIEF